MATTTTFLATVIGSLFLFVIYFILFVQFKFMKLKITQKLNEGVYTFFGRREFRRE
jgi:hypothetical protein|tara:strand:+ start:89 stop:256 length:168 start_codon:yes stop_codon:yes gene_type:complete